MNIIPRNSQSVLVPLYVQNMASPSALGLTGLSPNSPGLVCYYHRDIDNLPVVVPLAPLTVGTYNASGFAPISDTVAPGDYQFAAPNNCWATTGNFTTITLYGAANMLPIKMRFCITDVGIGYIAQSGINRNAFVPQTELSAPPTWPLNQMDAINWMAARSLNQTKTTANPVGSGGQDIVYKQDSVTLIGSGTYDDNGTIFTRGKYQ